MATKPKATLAPTEIPFVIEGLRKLALQRDTLRKYALDETSDSFDEDKAEGYTEDISSIRSLLATLGDTKPLVLKSERKAKAKPKAKATKAKAKAKPKAVAITKGEAEVHHIPLAELLG
jgi:hypothetical protein